MEDEERGEGLDGKGRWRKKRERPSWWMEAGINDRRVAELKEEMEERENLKGGMLAMEEEQVMNLGARNRWRS